MYMKMKNCLSCCLPVILYHIKSSASQSLFHRCTDFACQRKHLCCDLFIQFTEIFKVFLWQYQSVSPGCRTQIQNYPKF